MSSPAPSSGAGKPVPDYNVFCEGDLEPSLHKTVHTLIDRNQNYIVYVDEDGRPEWVFNGTTPDGFETVANKIADLETVSETQLLVHQRQPFARLLAESMARVLGDDNVAEAERVLEKAAAYLSSRGIENARLWYLQGAGLMSLPAVFISLALLWFRNRIANPSWLYFTEIIAASLMGGMGAFFSIASRTETANLDPVAGARIHRIEGMLRVAVGIIGASVVALAIKADVLFGAFQSLSHPLTVLMILCIAAGASERMASGLIKKMERSMGETRTQ